MPSPSDSQLPGLPGYDPYNLKPWTVAVVTAMTVLAAVAVMLRMLSRHLKGQQLWWDDWMIIFSMVWNLAVVGFIFAMYSSGMGIHADLVDLADIVMMAKWLVVAEILYAWNLGWTKLSLLLMYYRIFRLHYFKKVTIAVGAFVMAWVVCITFLFIFICVPVEKLWYPDLPGRCINQVGTWIANAASTILTDVVILLLPIPQIWKLQLTLREKIGITGVFGLGFFVVFASAYRTSVLFSYDANDPTYTLAPTVVWTDIEMSAGLISACLPTMLPIVNAVLQLLGIKSNSTYINEPSDSDTNGTTKVSHSRTSNTKDSKATNNNFYRLPDGNHSEGESGPNTSAPAAVDLRRDDLAYERSVKCHPRGSKDDSSGDEIPLKGIRVKTEFMRSGGTD